MTALKLDVLRPSGLRSRDRFLLAALAVLLTTEVLAVVALHASGRLRVTDAIFLAVAPWAVLAAASRPDWLLLALIALPASLTSAVQTSRALLLVAIALAALLITRRRFSLGLRTGLAALIIVNVAGHVFLAPVEQGAIAVNQGTMLNLTYYMLLALLALNLAMLGDLDGERLGSVLIVGVATTLVVGLAGYGGPWFEVGPGIISHTYLSPMVSAALGVSLARLLMADGLGKRHLGDLVTTGILLYLTIASRSRASWIAAAITFALLASRAGRRRYLLILTGAIALILLTPTARQEVSRSESGNVIAELQTGEIATGRWELWVGLWEQAQPALPWGNGFGYVWSLSSEDLVGVPGSYNSERSGHVPPHNDFMYMLVDFGIPGLLLLAFFWVQLFRARRLVIQSPNPMFRRSAWLLLGAIVTGLVFSLFDDLLVVRPLAERFFPIAGFVFGLAQVERTRRSGEGGSGTGAPAQATLAATSLP